MGKQLELFPELARKLVNVLDDKTEEYVVSHPVSIEVTNIEAWKRDIKVAFKDGASMVLGEIIDLLKKYTDLHES